MAWTQKPWLKQNSQGGKGGGKGPDNCKIYVGNISYKTRGWKLREHFQQAGNVTWTQLVAHKPQNMPQGKGYGKGFEDKHKGMAMVEFGSPAEATNALMHLQGSMCDGRPVILAKTPTNWAKLNCLSLTRLPPSLFPWSRTSWGLIWSSCRLQSMGMRERDVL
jgi:hypothetical protein